MNAKKKNQPKRTGRPQQPPSETINSQKEAASKLGVPVQKIRLAKEMGCDAFLSGGRLRMRELDAFLNTPAFAEAWEQKQTSEPGSWKDRLEKAKALTAETKLAILRGQYWQADQMRALITAGDRAMLDTLRRWVENELPPLAQGKPADQILTIGKKFLDEVIADMRDSREAAMRKLSESTPDEDAIEDEGAGE